MFITQGWKQMCRPSWIEDSLGFIERHESYGSVIKNGAAN